VEDKVYQVRYTVDELGDRKADGGSWYAESTNSLDRAKRVAEHLTQHGRCGFVRRTDTGAVLTDNGMWVAAHEGR